MFELRNIQNEIDPTFKDWLIHWTRAADGPWPGETRADYYREVAESRTDYVRSAKRTLERIEAERKLRASLWRIRSQTPVVSLSALPPSQAVSLMRWRSRYARYTIEPFGVAISQDAARSIGARPVIYSPNARTPSDSPTWQYQSPGARGEWPSEKEYRHPGDLDLAPLPVDSWKQIDLSGFLLGNG